MISASTLAGRERELSLLYEGLARAAAGRGGLYLLCGEPGIGKTRLATEVEESAARLGFGVAWGRCWRTETVPFWPWVQILRSLSEEHENVLAAQTTGAATGAADADRFHLFDRVAQLLHAASSEVPLAVFLDDLHAADDSSLRLLDFVARTLAASRLFVLATYRDSEPRRATGDLAGLTRHGQRIALGGLTDTDTASILTAHLGVPPSPELIALVHQRTDGVPLFVQEIARALAETDSDAPPAAELPVPMVVDELIRERVAALPVEAQTVLRAATVLGREIDVLLLHRLLDVPSAADIPPSVAALLDLLEFARAAGLVAPLTGSETRWCFAHDVIRDSLYASLPLAERASLHGRAASALEALHGSTPDAHHREMAKHLLEAGDVASRRRAIEHLRRAAAIADAHLAYEDAVTLYEEAIAAGAEIGMIGVIDEALRCELQLCLGDALWNAGRVADSRTTFAAAARVAEQVWSSGGSPHLLVRAALGLGGKQQRAHVLFDHEHVELLERALAAVRAEGGEPFARVAARLAYALYASPDSLERRTTLCREAREAANVIGSTPLSMDVLADVRWALWDADHFESRREITSERTRLALRAGNLTEVQIECGWRFATALEAGDRAAIDAELVEFAKRTDELRLPWFRWYRDRYRFAVALLEARLEDAEQLAAATQASGNELQHPDATLIFASQIFSLRRFQGREAEVEQGISAMSAMYPHTRSFQFALVSLLARLKRRDEVARRLRSLAADHFAAVPRDFTRVLALAQLAEGCAVAGDAELAAQLDELLSPYAGRCVVVGNAIACLGSVSHFLGMLSVVRGRRDEAVQRFEAAMRVHQRLRAPLLVAETSRQLEALASEASAAPALAVVTLKRDGEVWSIRHAERTFHLRPQPGLDYLSRLLANPGVEVTASELAGRAARSNADGIEGIREQLRDCREELEEATRQADLGRVELVESRLDELETQLLEASSAAAASGSAVEAERARSAVTMAIASTRKRIEAHDPLLARCLQATVRTGRVCRYDPDAQFGIAWQVVGDEPALPQTAPERRTLAGSVVPRDAEIVVQRSNGSCTIQLGETTIRLRDSHGCAYLQHLLQRPGVGVSATDLAGLTRADGEMPDAERARVAVTRAIHAVYRRIKEHHPGLERYLAVRIHTGMVCRYSPTRMTA